MKSPQVHSAAEFLEWIGNYQYQQQMEVANSV